MAINGRAGTFGISPMAQRQQELPGATPTSVPPAVTGANIVELNVPQTMGVQGTATITGRVHYNNISRPLTNTPVRIQARGEGITPVTHQVDDLSHCNERSFSLEVPAVGQAGDVMNITVVSQSSPVGSWTDDETQGPFTIQILSQQAQAQRTLTQFAPWAIGGGAVGGGVASFTDRSATTGALVGAGAGVGVKALTEQGGITEIIGFPEIDVLPIVALAALLGGGALFLGEVTDLDLPGVGDVRERMPTRSGNGSGGTQRRSAGPRQRR